MLHLMEMIGTFLVVWKVTEVLMNLDNLVGVRGLVKNMCKGMGWGKEVKNYCSKDPVKGNFLLPIKS